jgi:hypothetical protein
VTNQASAITLALVVGCNPLGPSEPAFPRQDAIRKATEQARQSAPELGIQDARVDNVTAELITLAEASRRFRRSLTPHHTSNRPVRRATRSP